MITIEGKYSKAVIYAASLDPGAEGLIRAFCNSPASEGAVIRIMPDVHSGKGCAIGTTVRLAGRVSPGLVGTDIGCGMTAARIDSSKRLELQKLDKLIHERIPAGACVRQNAHRFADKAGFIDELRCARHVRREKALLSMGTLGGGNHFIELDRGEDGSFWIVVHSGSRCLGTEIEKYYHDLAFKASHEGVPYELAYLDGGDMENYLHDSAIAAEYAEINRNAIIDEIVRGMKLDTAENFSSRHNYIDTDSMILRKGAVSAKAGERLIIPMNMRDGCLMCVGKGDPEWNESAPHGAGRLMSRSDAKQSFTLSQFKKEMKEVYSTTVSRETLDESPMAYKPMSEITALISDTVKITGLIRPVYNFKAGSE